LDTTELLITENSSFRLKLLLESWKYINHILIKFRLKWSKQEEIYYVLLSET